MENKHNRIVLVGGHATTALAVYEELKKRGYTDFYWLGHKYSMLADKEPSAEFKLVQELGIPFSDIKAGKIYRHLSWFGIISLLRIPVGLFQAYRTLKKINPHIIISFGGYLAVPVACAGWLLRIPVITHEQTLSHGLSNQVIAKFARKIMLGWKESISHFPKSKVIVTGNPIRTSVFVHDHMYYDFKNDLPTILVMGGNQGSHLINKLVKESLTELTKQFNIIHQCGSNTLVHDYELLAPLMMQYPNYQVRKGIWGDDIGRALHQAALIVSRSGANTVYELAALHKYALLIPLAYAQNNEQFLNASMLSHIGLGEILEEKDLSVQTFLAHLKTLYTTFQQQASNQDIQKQIADQIKNLIQYDASEKIADVIDSILHSGV